LGQVGNDEAATEAECEEVCEPVVFLLGISWDGFGFVVDLRCCTSTLLGGGGARWLKVSMRLLT
jgi:hypothetical protein